MINNENIALDVKDRILGVARTLFVEKGYKGTSIRDIASASETNVAMVNYYFRSKRDLFEIIFSESFDILTQRVFSILNSDIPFFELIEEWINSYYDTFIEYPQIPRFILNEINHERKAIAEKMIGSYARTAYIKIEQRIKEEVERGNIRDVPAIDLMLNIISLCVFPFVFKELATQVADKTSAEYKEVLMNHKRYVVDFTISALKP